MDTLVLVVSVLPQREPHSIDPPENDDDKVHPVPRIRQVRPLVTDKAHCDYFHCAFDRKQSREYIVSVFHDRIAHGPGRKQVAIQIHVTVIRKCKDDGICDDHEQDELVKALPCDAPDDPLAEAAAFRKQSQ